MVEIEPVPVLGDNYAWLVRAAGDPKVVVVDPGEAAPVAARLDERGLALAAILVTHHHGDHVGGVETLAGREGAVTVAGPRCEAIDGVTAPLDEGDRVDLAGVELVAWHTPGHTSGHLCYLGDGFVFTGDTLFAGGCGRLFEGRPAEMAGSLARLAALPAETLVYCAHEYTLANLEFALAVEPGNDALAERIEQARRRRAEGLPTVPSTIALELATNPFLRTTEPTVRAAAEARAGRQLGRSDEVFAVIRRFKDGWRPVP